MLSRIFTPRTTAYAHCDLPCGVYDPAQARLEAESVKACMVKYNDSSDADFRARAISIKEDRSTMVKEHLWVLWTDYFKAPHFEKYPNLNTLFNEATKLAGAGGTKSTTDVAVADALLAKIDEIAAIFWETKKVVSRDWLPQGFGRDTSSCTQIEQNSIRSKHKKPPQIQSCGGFCAWRLFTRSLTRPVGCAACDGAAPLRERAARGGGP